MKEYEKANHLLASQVAHFLVKLNFERTAAAWSPPNRKYGCVRAAAAEIRPLLRKPLSDTSFVARSHPLPESRSRIVKSGLNRVYSLHLFKSYPTVFISKLKFFNPAVDLKFGIAICKSTIPAEYISNRSGLFSCNNICKHHLALQGTKYRNMVGKSCINYKYIGCYISAEN
jgi:hypothetical protein